MLRRVAAQLLPRLSTQGFAQQAGAAAPQYGLILQNTFASEASSAVALVKPQTAVEGLSPLNQLTLTPSNKITCVLPLACTCSCVLHARCSAAHAALRRYHEHNHARFAPGTEGRPFAYFVQVLLEQLLHACVVPVLCPSEA
jgi:hypothetical protein